MQMEKEHIWQVVKEGKGVAGLEDHSFGEERWVSGKCNWKPTFELGVVSDRS